MNSRDVILSIFYFIIYLALQVFLMRNMVLFDVGFCFIYIAFLLLLPFDTNSVLLLLLGFGTGLLVDIFYDTMGIHAAASTFIMYLRPYVIMFITPRGGYEQNMRLNMQSMGLEWFLPYMLSLTFIHHTILFFVEASQLSLFLFTLLKVVCSTVFTCVIIILIQYLFYTSKSRSF
ncbi:Rod shape-determining protein MreD [Rhodocytophaga rosea]|uniref:Rod shape-determining protein MreD n=1 Tax=Rhodocytophaga rosea TaxID=2704465 RepID=A0A6C0GKW8_9BACT|nr:Rod shape-determining protein MreD [Rhodocytophaga rosea]QHT68619.1 Rod shape-determining protein MreD [Rhodocytophaga rosea]